jgi:hypothetical protein
METTMNAGSKIDAKFLYLTHRISYEAALSRLKKLGMNEGKADDYLHEHDVDWRTAMIKNGDIKDGPTLLADMFNNPQKKPTRSLRSLKGSFDTSYEGEGN